MSRRPGQQPAAAAAAFASPLRPPVYQVFLPGGADGALLSELVTTLTSDAKFAFDPNGAKEGSAFDARWARRQQLRVLHGHVAEDGTKRPLPSEDGVACSISKIKDGARISYDYSTEAVSGQVILDGVDIQSRQKKVDFFADFSAIERALHEYGIRDKTPLDIVRDIQLLKGGKSVKLPLGRDFQDYKPILEQLASYIVVRGVLRQHYEFDGSPIFDIGREVPVYYACFPKLVGDRRRRTNDLAQLCEQLPSGEFVFKGPAIEAVLKEKFKGVILLQMHVAAMHGEGVDIVTPHAFFGSLTEAAKNRAKMLFEEAALEAATTFLPVAGKIPLFLSLHGNDELKAKFAKAQADLKVPVLVGNGDATSPNRAMVERGRAERVAVCVMGEPVGPVGNGALSDRANSAMEENLARVCLSETCLIFGSGYNCFILPSLEPTTTKITKFSVFPPFSAGWADLNNVGVLIQKRLHDKWPHGCPDKDKDPKEYAHYKVLQAALAVTTTVVGSREAAIAAYEQAKKEYPQYADKLRLVDGETKKLVDKLNEFISGLIKLINEQLELIRNGARKSEYEALLNAAVIALTASPAQKAVSVRFYSNMRSGTLQGHVQEGAADPRIEALLMRVDQQLGVEPAAAAAAAPSAAAAGMFAGGLSRRSIDTLVTAAADAVLASQSKTGVLADARPASAAAAAPSTQDVPTSDTVFDDRDVSTKGQQKPPGA